MIGRRILIRGTSASGKSTLGRELGKVLGIEHTEIDSIYHMPGWQPREATEFIEIIDELTSRESWIVDGNYSKVRAMVEERAEVIVYLDYPLPLILARLTRRTFRRWFHHELLWGTNYESLWRHLFVPKDSLFWWVLTTYKKRRVEARAAASRADFAAKTILLFRSPMATQAWLDELRRTP